MSALTTTPLLKVITVDDSPLIAERLDSILSEIDSLIFCGNAFSSLSAKKLIQAVMPDVVILDLQLSPDARDETGVDLLQEIHTKYPLIKIIVFTNHSEPHYRQVCLRKGASHFLDKSNDSHNISEILNQWTIGK